MHNEPNPVESLATLLHGLSTLPDLAKKIDSLEADVASLRKSLAESKTPKKWLTQKEAAAILGTSIKTVRRYVERGFLRRNEASRYILIPQEDVEDFVNKVTFHPKANRL
jgi:excisionase family DNA binding protein